MDVGNEHLSHVVRRRQKRRLLAVTGVNANPLKPHLPGPRLAQHDIECMSALRRQRARIRALVGFATQQAVGVLADLSQVPGRVADEMMELLRATLVNYGRHRREGAVRCLRQSAQIASCRRRAVAGLGTEELAVAVYEDDERLRHRTDQRSG